MCPLETHSTAPYKQARGIFSPLAGCAGRMELPSREEGCSDLCRPTDSGPEGFEHLPVFLFFHSSHVSLLCSKKPVPSLYQDLGEKPMVYLARSLQPAGVASKSAWFKHASIYLMLLSWERVFLGAKPSRTHLLFSNPYSERCRSLLEQDFGATF